MSLRETGAGKQANSRLKWEEDAAVASMPEIFLPVSTAELSWRVLGFVNGLRLLASSALATACWMGTVMKPLMTSALAPG